MITTAKYEDIAHIIKTIADAEILTRFRTLTDSDIAEKRPGDLVTTADRVAEERLTEALEKFLPGSVTVGEEAVSGNPDILKKLSGTAPVWVVDPVDGTSNFVAGVPDYACLVSLAVNGHTTASWIYAPSLKLTAGALTGTGAWINGTPHTLTTRPDNNRLDIVTTHRNYIDGHEPLIAKLHRDDITTTDCRAAGLTYVDLAQGQHDALVYTWENPWDHAAGLHLYQTCGGDNATIDGRPFNLAGGNTLPFIVATEPIINRLTHILTT
ncbi:MAG TPA: inositol monophosphatase [Candidatus Stackebrandtia excrementipullorum]|nr:inositol monophosphatase [Candidatus Stackebrandtia excrementipullorum]